MDGNFSRRAAPCFDSVERGSQQLLPYAPPLKSLIHEEHRDVFHLPYLYHPGDCAFSLCYEDEVIALRAFNERAGVRVSEEFLYAFVRKIRGYKFIKRPRDEVRDLDLLSGVHCS